MKSNVTVTIDFTEEEMDVLQQACRILGQAEGALNAMKNNGYRPFVDDLKYPKILDEYFRKLKTITEWFEDN